MALRRRKQPPPPCACGCQLLAERLAADERVHAAIIRAIITLRPRSAHHTVAEGLVGWGVDPADAAVLAEAIRPT